MTNSNQPDHLFFAELEVQNVRAFGERQVIRLTDDHSRPIPWTRVLGENGVGKTTLLQALARMRPVPAVEVGSEGSGSVVDSGVHDRSEPELSGHDDVEIRKFIRLGKPNQKPKPTCIEATLTSSG